MNEHLLANDIKVVINKRQLKNNHQIVTKTKLLPGRDKAILTIVTFEAVIKHEINRKKKHQGNHNNRLRNSNRRNYQHHHDQMVKKTQYTL